MASLNRKLFFFLSTIDYLVVSVGCNRQQISETSTKIKNFCTTFSGWVSQMNPLSGHRFSKISLHLSSHLVYYLFFCRSLMFIYFFYTSWAFFFAFKTLLRRNEESWSYISKYIYVHTFFLLWGVTKFRARNCHFLSLKERSKRCANKSDMGGRFRRRKWLLE